MNKPTLYKIYRPSPDGEYVIYLGRTRNNLTKRLRNHFITHHPFQKEIKLCEGTRIEYAEFDTLADMYVAEIAYINIIKPPLNVEDKAHDELTLRIDLSQVEWRKWDKKHLLDKWMGKII